MSEICIAHGGDISTPSGGSNRIVAMASTLHQQGHEVSVVAPEYKGHPPDRVAEIAFEEVSLPQEIENPVTRAVAVVRRATAVADERDAVIQFEHSILGGIGALYGNCSFVLDMHDLAYSRYDHVQSLFAVPMKHIVARIERRAVDSADRVIVVSGHMKERIRYRWKVPEKKITVIPNGFFESKLDSHRETNVLPGRVCFLGTLHPKVNLNVIAQICELSSVSDVIVIGDGAQRNQLEELATERSVLTLTGRIPDQEAFELLASSSVAINPQYSSELQRSSSPVKLYYYAALGKPMVVTAGPPVANRLSTADAAIITQSDNEFVKSVDTVLRDPNLADRLGHNARELAEEFRWQSRTESITRIYE